MDLNSTDYIIDQPEAKLTVKSFIGKKDVKMSDALDDIRKSKDSAAISDILTARVKGSFSTYIEYMEDMFKKKHGKIDKNLIIIDSYNGAEHKKTTKGKTSIISFNSQLISPSSISTVSPASSTNIFTWQQVVGEEKFATLLPALKKCTHTKLELDKIKLKVINMKVNQNILCTICTMEKCYTS